MKRILTIFLVSIATILGLQKIPANLKIESLPEVTFSPEPNPSPQVARIVIACDSTCTDQEKAELPKLVDLLTKTENSQCFKDYLSNGKLDLSQAKNMTLDQVISLVTTSKVNSTLTYYYKRRNPFTGTIVVGYENGDGKIHANRAAWKNLTPCEKAANMGHEISHGKPMEFTHDYNNTARRPFSVPYMIGSAISACCKL